MRAGCRELEAALTELERAPVDEFLEFHLYTGLDWLERKGRQLGDPVPWLRRAYRELLRQTAFLEPALRQRFLFQIPEHEAILDEATRRGLSLPPLGVVGER